MFSRFVVSSFYCLLVCLTAFSQSAANIKKGDACMKKNNYPKAVAFYKKAVADNTKDATAKEKLGAAFTALGSYQSAEMVYKQLVSNPTAEAINKFYYAQILRINKKYAEAGVAYKVYFNEHLNDPLAGEFENFDTKIKTLLSDTGHCKLINLAENTASSDEGPAFCLYSFCFTTNGHSGARSKTYNLYMSFGTRASGGGSGQKLKGEVKGRLDEGPATFSRNGKEMIFTRSNYSHKSADGVIKLGLYHADYDSAGKKWVKIMPLNITDYNYTFMQPSLSKDGSMLFFASDVKGGLGGTDIYVSYKQGNRWSAPVNLGSRINTSGNEQTPFIADNGTLYFASDSRMGLGGFDIYSTTLLNGGWSRATNLGGSFNSSYNDFGYISDAIGLSGYIISNRPGGKGGNDIYQFIFLR